MSVFDPKTFESMTFTESNSIESIPIPIGEWPFTFTKREVKGWQKKDDPSVAGLKLVLTAECEDAEVATVTGRAKSSLQHELMLDLTPDGMLDFGKGMNVKLGQCREACGLNAPGQSFSFDMFMGHTVKFAIKHEVYQERLLAKIVGVSVV